MNYTAFNNLLMILLPHLILGSGRTWAPNGVIPPELRLALALRYFAGGSALDIMISHHMLHTEVYNSVWMVVDAVNATQSFDIEYPKSHRHQQRIARDFISCSKAGFSNCAGCIDGLLIWMEKPSEMDCKESGVDCGKFYCGRKGKFGLNMQGVCDARRRFIDISIQNPASASDFLSYATSNLYGKVSTPGFLAPGLSLFGDNAYVNCMQMVVPFMGATGGTKDSFNYYHSQVCINIECAFGILTNRWHILKSPLRSMSISKIVALAICLCKLHNFCIDQGNGNEKVPGRYKHDRPTIMDFSDIVCDQGRRPVPLLNGGSHFDVQRGAQGAASIARRDEHSGTVLPQDLMSHHVQEQGLRRPKPRKRNV